MPFRSIAQERWAYTKEGMEALGGPEKVAEWQAATPAKLPSKVKAPNNRRKAIAKALMSNGR